MSNTGLSRRKFVLAAGGVLGATPFLSAGEALAAAPRQVDQASTKTFYWISENIADPFYVPGIAGMKEAARLLGFKAQLVGPSSNSTAGQAQVFQEVVAKPDTGGILAYSIDFHALAPIARQAQAKGIPIVNGNADWGPPRDAFIGTPLEELVGAAVNVTVAALGGKGVVGFCGNTGINVVQRGQLFAQELKKYPGISFAGATTYDGSVAGAVSALNAFLGTHPKLDLIWFGDGTSGSVASSLASRAPKLKLVGTDVPPVMLQALQKRQAYATVGQDTFTEEFFGFQALYYLSLGYRVPDQYNLAPNVLTAGNVATFLKNPYRRT